ncbi:MAG: N-(5'-phosphoribosyl)anthranilate isomerase, partial [Planctomycetes bacterium]|nr:N-(5'-phosphoribosyl)anthranilate isomerase [Planctomycetota bacterium]
MEMVRVKICGITNANDARSAAHAGADAVGLNFVAGPRRITPEQATPILDALPPFCEPVALINLDTNPLGDALWTSILQMPIRTVQLYGSATGTSLASFPHGRLNPIIVHTV